MFTGIVESVGIVVAVEDGEGAPRLIILGRQVTSDLRIGGSVAVDGVCLTVVEFVEDRFTVNVGAETLRRTTLGRLSTGARVNLERPLRMDQRLGGHLVQGHVDGVGVIGKIQPEGAARWMEVVAPHSLRPYVVEKGSVAVDGVSLTVARPTSDGFAVSLIPHTLAATALGEKRVGEVVNIEVDIIAKYVQRFVAAYLKTARGAVHGAAVRFD